MSSIVRPYRPDDLGPILKLWEDTAPLGSEGAGLTVDEAVDLLRADGAVALVAEFDGRVVGMVLGLVSSVVGWIHLLRVRPDEPSAARILGDLLSELEVEMREGGARKIVTLTRAGQELGRLLEERGFVASASMIYMERRLDPVVTTPSQLTELGGRMIDPGLWDRLKGMEEAKRTIDRRVILPLSEPEVAARHAVSTPKAIVLFGPPGTGKTTFAKGIASRLDWPFVEIHPSELAGEGADRQARALAKAFTAVLDLPAAVMFVDEVEDIASARTEDRRVTPSITNEFLKQIPRFRDAQHHLLVCATNWVGRLDQAFLRPGRFDHVLPVGPPDGEARAAIWRGYVTEITGEPIDIEELVEASELFTPADIEYAAGRAAQRAFEREVFDGDRQRATTKDFLKAIEETRPTLTDEMVRAFADNVARFARY